jgi:hypothetical protein
VWPLKSRSRALPKVGDIVYFTTPFGSVNPSVVLRVLEDRRLDLLVFGKDGSFSELAIAEGGPHLRCSWHYKG